MTAHTVLSSDDLTPDAARQLDELAGAIEPGKLAPTRRPDELLYRIVVEREDGRTVEVDASDSTLARPARRLVEWVAQRPERRKELPRRP